ncbi:hypothetical protein H310_08868 [Aphanomyces invadans]|uniref:SCD domain-containing protein n=1 Tax=Aphanomyces invadans TaxID=157072 RepID=A0A024TVV5_9STRA|nr:hypothetical protein H310_08868 [Aphanomyces invadans]ETV98124.1 hypothetical protein H310_08868 [Aphanomyces invadans]|eukprot:XP_008872999.1 hypothetical protein H310_08868 [Aphanomyces invadans]
MPRRHVKERTNDTKSAEHESEAEDMEENQETQVNAPASSKSRSKEADNSEHNEGTSSTQGGDPEDVPDDEVDEKTPPAKLRSRTIANPAASTVATKKDGKDNDKDDQQQKSPDATPVDNEPTRTPATAQRRSARAHNPAPVYTSPAVSASKRDSESTAFEPRLSQPKTPIGRPPRPTERTLRVQAGKSVKDTSKHVKSARDDGSDDESEFMLYEAVKSGSSSIATLAREWRSRFEADADAASRELINFIMNACGSASICVEEQDDLDELDLMAFVDTVVVSLQASEQQVYPLASKAKGCRKFKDNFESFWKHFVEECWDSELIHTTDIVEKAVDWLNSLSSSEVRAIRHTSTFAAYAIGNALVARAKQLTDQLVPINRQCAAADMDGKTTPKSKAKSNPKLARLLELKGTYEEQLANTMTYLTSLFNGVIVHRYRDTMPELRIESVQTLGLWIETLPGEFLVDNYLKFLGWMLNDKSSKVRLAVVDALQTLYSHEANAGKLALFTTRFLRRYLEMCDDVDDNVVLSIVELLAKIDRLNLLDGESDLSVVERLVFDPDSRIRRSAAEFVCLQYDAFGVSDHDMTEAQLIVQAVALVEFAEEYMGCDGKDEALDRIDLLVTAFWDNADCQVLTNWRLLAVLLGSDTHEPSLSSHQQTILICMLIGTIKQIGATGHGVTKKPRKKGDESEPMTIFFCREIPTLMLRFQSEPAKLCLLLQLVSTLNWNDTTIMNQHKKHVEELLGRLKHAYTTHSDERFLQELSRCVHHMTELSNTALARQAAVLEQELMRDSIEQCQTLLKQDKKSKSKDTEFGLQAWLARLHFLSGYINLNDVNLGDLPETLATFVHDRTALVDLAAGPRLASSCVQYAAQILFKAFLWSSAPLFDAIHDAASVDEAATTSAMDDLVQHRDNLEFMLLRLLSVHLSASVTASTPTDQVHDIPELELTNYQISYVNDLHKTAFLLLSDLRCLCTQRFEDAVAPFSRLAYRPHKNLLMLSQSYFERVMNDGDADDDTKQSVLVALACTSLCNPQNKRQAAAVLQHMTSDAFQPLVKAFGKRMMAVSVVKYLEIQMLSLQQTFEETGEAAVELAKVLNQSLGAKLPATIRGSLLKFMSEGMRYGLDAPENAAFFAIVKPYLGRLDKASLKTLHNHLSKLLAGKPDMNPLDHAAVADMVAVLSGEKDAVVMAPKPAVAAHERVRDNLSDDDGKPVPRRSRNLSDDEDDDEPKLLGQQPSPKARTPRAKRISNANADDNPKKKRISAMTSQNSGDKQDAAMTPSRARTKTPPTRANSIKRTPQRRSTRSKVVVELDSDDQSDDEDVEDAEADLVQEEAPAAARKRKSSTQALEQENTRVTRGKRSKPVEAVDAPDVEDTNAIADDNDDEVVGFRPKRRRQ